MGLPVRPGAGRRRAGAARPALAGRVGRPWRELFPQRFVVARAGAWSAVFLAFAVVLSQVNPAGLRRRVHRRGRLHRMDDFDHAVRHLLLQRLPAGQPRWRLFGYRGRFILMLVALVCLFGAGEEISWGQRVFDIETPQSLHGAQCAEGDEPAQPDLRMERQGSEDQPARLRPRTDGCAARSTCSCSRRFIAATRGCGGSSTAGRSRCRRRTRCSPTWSVVAVVELLIDSSKRGEMTEFAGAIVFMLNVVFAGQPAHLRSARHGRRRRGRARAAQP